MTANTTFSANPVWLDTGDQAWQLTAGTLVGMQTIPGLGQSFFPNLANRRHPISPGHFYLSYF